MERLYYGENITLKVLDASFAGQVLKFYQDNEEEFSKWDTDWPDYFLSREFHRKTIEQENHYFEQDSYIRFYIFDREDTEFQQIIGTISFSKIRHQFYHSAEMGYKIDHRYLRRGYATKGVSLALQIVFEELELHRINCFVSVDNEPSIAFMEKQHFTREGCLKDYVRLRGQWKDHYLYSFVSGNC